MVLNSEQQHWFDISSGFTAFNSRNCWPTIHVLCSDAASFKLRQAVLGLNPKRKFELFLAQISFKNTWPKIALKNILAQIALNSFWPKTAFKVNK